MNVAKEHVTHPDEAFRLLRVRTDGSAGRWHRHPQVELTWIERGNGIRFVGDSAAPFSVGDLVLLGPNVPHLWLSSVLQPGETLQATVVQFPLALLHVSALPELARAAPVVERAAVGLRVGGEAHAAITAALARMHVQAPLQRLGTLFDVLGALAGATTGLQALGTRAAHADAGKAAERRVQRVIDWVHSNLHRSLPVAEAAAIAHVTPAAFSRFFRRETGKTYAAYVNEVRCSAACLRLRRSDQPVALVAEACGFGTLSNFNRQFLARTGKTPRAYRQEA